MESIAKMSWSTKHNRQHQADSLGDQAYAIKSLDIDSEIQIINAYAKKGLYETIELSVGNRSKVVVH